MIKYQGVTIERDAQTLFSEIDFEVKEGEFIYLIGNVGLAVDAAVSMHSKRTAVAGALTCLGGLVMLPAGIIADVANLFAMQLRMLQTIALLRGLDIYDERVKKICIYVLQVQNWVMHFLRMLQ